MPYEWAFSGCIISSKKEFDELGITSLQLHILSLWWCTFFILEMSLKNINILSPPDIFTSSTVPTEELSMYENVKFWYISWDCDFLFLFLLFFLVNSHINLLLVNWPWNCWWGQDTFVQCWNSVAPHILFLMCWIKVILIPFPLLKMLSTVSRYKII